MKILKILSIVGLVGYLLFYFYLNRFLEERFLEQDDMYTGVIVNVVYYLYFVFHTVMCLLRGIKTKNTVLKISSIIVCAAAAIILLIRDITFNALEYALPFAIALSIIALVQSSKTLKQK